MAKTNTPVSKSQQKRLAIQTHEGAPAKNVTAELELRRSVMSCLLWEKGFYEDGKEVAERIQKLIPKVSALTVSKIAIQAREDYKLRHVPLLIVREMARINTHKHLVAYTLERVIQRADELAEFVAIYWKDGKQPLSAQVKKGLAKAFNKFNEYELAKYNQDGAVKLRDVLFLCHAKPLDKAQGKLWKKLVEDKLETPDTWEVAISACKSEAEKKKEWTRLVKERALGSLALLRNLRNMDEVGVPAKEVKAALSEMKVDRVLPYRFISAARYAPKLEPELEEVMYKCVENESKLKGKTTLLIDVSGSMDGALSGKSDLTRIDAACGLAILLRELCDSVEVYTFSSKTVLVPARRGFALRDAINNSQEHGSTHLGAAVKKMNELEKRDRLIVISDEQSQDSVGKPDFKGAYMINVASDKNGVGYGKQWTHMDGFSEAVVSFVREYERLNG